MSNLDCDQRLCEDGSSFPDGMCTLSCGTSGNCPSGSSCAELDSGWVCMLNCMTITDCRTSYVCVPQIEAGTNGNSMVSVCTGMIQRP